MERRLQVFAPDGMVSTSRSPFRGHSACSGDVWLPIDPMVPECLSEESACTVVELFEMPE